jgi:hypothetical protein
MTAWMRSGMEAPSVVLVVRPGDDPELIASGYRSFRGGRRPAYRLAFLGVLAVGGR